MLDGHVFEPDYLLVDDDGDPVLAIEDGRVFEHGRLRTMCRYFPRRAGKCAKTGWTCTTDSDQGACDACTDTSLSQVLKAVDD